MGFQAHELASIRPPPPPIRATSNPSQSTVSNNDYRPIDMQMLAAIAPEYIARFRDYLQTIPFLYNDLAPSILGRHLVTEADVRMYFDASIVLAVWPVALAMVPVVRTADLVLTSENTYSSPEHLSRPDVSIVAYDGDVETAIPIGHIKYKGPQGLEDFKNVFRAWSEGTRIQLPFTWTIVTQQLRKYAEITKCRSILCSDESDAYLFVFPEDDSSEEVYFLHASNAGGTLTLREAVLYLVYLAIEQSPCFTLRYVYTHLCLT
jgi:hypothetical protein